MSQIKISKSSVLFILILFLLSFYNTPFAEARSGCCSHHGGVCGCRCCDGTPLSAKCAPYYPNCSDSQPTYPKQNYTQKYEAISQRSQENKEAIETERKESVYVGSINSNKYHYTWCRWAKKIKPQNLIVFSSVKEAKSKGYVPCKVCMPPGKDEQNEKSE